MYVGTRIHLDTYIYALINLSMYFKGIYVSNSMKLYVFMHACMYVYARINVIANVCRGTLQAEQLCLREHRVRSTLCLVPPAHAHCRSPRGEEVG